MLREDPLRLEDPETIPLALRDALAAHGSLMHSEVRTESLVQGGPLAGIASALADHLHRQTIIGYHCTREPEPGYFATHGLRATNLAEHQDEFLRRLGHHFTFEELAYMRKQWHSYFNESQKRSREGRVWACLTRALAVSTGTEPFFAAYGGEAIHMPLADDSSAKQKLAALGQPVIVEVALPGDRIRTFCEMAYCALSYYHRRVNPASHLMESEAYLLDGIRPLDVLSVVPLAEFNA
jgi:hypothetical protein